MRPIMPGGLRRKRARERQRVLVDVNGLMRGAIGDAGLSDEDLGSYGPRFDAMAVGLERQRRLGSSALPAAKTELKRTSRLVEEVRGSFDDLLVLANEDVAAGVRALVGTTPARNDAADRSALRVHVVDGLDPERLMSLLARLDLRRSLCNVVSATGDGLATMSQFLIVRDRLLKELGAVEYKHHVVITTGAGEGALRQIVNDEGFRDLPFPSEVEDRFAVLSAAAFFPAACAGTDLAAIVAGAADMAKRCESADVASNPGHVLAIGLSRTRTCRVAPAPVALQPLAAWIENVSVKGADGDRARLNVFLEAEHPSDDVEVPTTFQDLESIGYLGGQQLGMLAGIERDAREAALWNAGRPNVRLICPQVDEYVVGQVVCLVQTAVALARELGATEGDAADAAMVSAARLAYGLAGRPGYEAERAEAHRLAARNEARYVL